jgi:hypothetical protein
MKLPDGRMLGVADAIPNSHLEVYPGEGHLSLSAKYTEQFLRFLAT